MTPRRRVLGAAALLLAALAVPAPAKDIGAGTMGAVSDLLSNASADQPPPGVDPDTYRKAIEALKKEGLAGAGRPARPGDTALLQKYANALLLGPRAKDFRDQIGAVHDAVLSGDDATIAAAIRALHEAMGRAPPAEAAMPKLIADARSVGGDAPSETINHSIERPDYRIDIVDAPAARDAAVEVVVKDGPGGKPARVLFEGETHTGGRQGGEGLDRQVVPSAPCAMDTAAAAKLREQLNGEWKGPNGTVTISGSGESIVIAESRPGGRQLRYEGTFRLGKIDARHAITHPDDIENDLPGEIRSQLAGMGLYFTLRLETCRDPVRLSGRWGSQHVTYNNFMQVKRVHDPYDQSYVLSRTIESPDYRIAKLHISYEKWEQAQSELRARQSIAQDELKRAEDKLRQETAAYEERRQRTNDLYRAFIAAEQAFNAAEKAIVDYVPPDVAKSDAYRKLEQQRVKLARRVDMLYEGIIATVDGGKNVVEPVAFENYQRLQAELDGIDAELARLDGELGFNTERERLRKAATEAFVAKVRAETELEASVAVQDLARAREGEADVALSEARTKLSLVEQELARFTENAPRVSGVTAEDGAIMKYETVYWDPSEVLDYLNGEIPKLERVLERASAARRDTRREFLDQQATASRLQDELAEAIMDSAWGQASVEMAFNLADMVEKGIEGGPIAAIGEGGKKIVEAVILGPPSLYEPAMAPEVLTGDGGPFADIRKDIQDSLKYAAKRGFKTAVTGQAASLLVKKYIESRSTATYMQLIDQAIEGSMETGYRVAGATQAQKAVEAFDAMQKAREKFQKAVKDGAFPRYAEVAGKSLKETIRNATKDPRMRKLGASIMKDVAKGEIKEQIGELIEGRAMRAYVAAEGEARIATQVFLAASNVYWESYDPYHEKVEHRREILRQYDQNNHMQIKKDERFKDGAEILVVLRDLEGRPLKATNHAVTVTLGGKRPKSVATDEYFLVFDASDLEHDGVGGVTLDISVER